MTNYGNDIDPATLQALRMGEQAIARVTGDGHWEDWTQIGEGLLALRGVAMRRAFTNQPMGRRYSEEFSRLLDASPYRQIDKSPRSFLLRCMEDRADIEAWRSTLPLESRMKWAYPKTVFNHWQAHIRKMNADPNAEKKPSLVTTLKDRNAELEERNARLERAGGSHIDLDADTTKDIAAVIVGKGLSRAKSIMRELANQIRAAEQKFAEKGK